MPARAYPRRRRTEHRIVEGRQRLRLKPLRTEAERIESRLEKIRTTIAEHDANPEAAVEKELASLLRSVRSAEDRGRGKSAKPAPEKPANETPAAPAPAPEA